MSAPDPTINAAFKEWLTQFSTEVSDEIGLFDDAGDPSDLLRFVHAGFTDAWELARKRDRDDVTITTYRSDRSREFYWRVQSKGNGKIVGASSEGYGQLADCDGNLLLLTGWVPDVREG